MRQKRGLYISLGSGGSYNARVLADLAHLYGRGTFEKKGGGIGQGDREKIIDSHAR